MRPPGGANYDSQKPLQEFLRRGAGRAPSEGHPRWACCSEKLGFSASGAWAPALWAFGIAENCSREQRQHKGGSGIN